DSPRARAARGESPSLSRIRHLEQQATMGTNSITIQMEPATLTALTESGYSLLAFAAVQVSDAEAQPLVWFTTQSYLETTQVQYGAGYQAFTAAFAVPASPVAPGFSTTIAPGQELLVQTSFGTGLVTENGWQGALAIANQTTTPFQCGISEPVGGAFAPVCLLPLHGYNGQLIVPLPSILLMFSTGAPGAGTPLARATGPGVLLDVGTEPAPQVSYDIDQGWDWGQAAWGQAVAFGAPLAPLLTPASETLASAAQNLNAQLAMHGRAAQG
ncbi:MAG TPA: hypothetical protein VK358_16100, partial [Longimicrobium sp.]|nr:hypothetical protein [Longimicrobium sp.]